MLSYRDLERGFRSLGLDSRCPVIAHASVKSFGEIRGGSEALLGALLAVQPRLIMPAHTYKTMILPEEGPDENAALYGAGKDLNTMAEFFTPDMPCDPLVGTLPEQLRLHPLAKRSSHPILSFTGIGVDASLEAQTLQEPLASISKLAEENGWVLLLGVDHTVNTSIHLAEKLAGRRQFIRWALTPESAVECPNFPGCSLGFEKAAPHLVEFTRQVNIGSANLRALPLNEMIDTIVELISNDPLALLCDDPGCERCAEHKALSF